MGEIFFFTFSPDVAVVELPLRNRIINDVRPGEAHTHEDAYTNTALVHRYSKVDIRRADFLPQSPLPDIVHYLQ